MRWLLLALVPTCLYGQNLVPNPSFEDTIQCPTWWSTPGDDQLLLRCQDWYAATKGTSDYFNACDTSGVVGVPFNFGGYQPAAMGSAYAGFINFAPNSWREYLGVDLSPLNVGLVYCVSFKVNLANASGYASNEIGVYFYLDGPGAILDTTINMPVVPQVDLSDHEILTDTVNWTCLEGTFTPDSAYEHMFIGGFNNNANTGYVPTGHGANMLNNASYYYVDDVSIWEIQPTQTDLAGRDTALCAMNNGLFIGVPPVAGYAYEWDGNGITGSTSAQIEVNPDVSTSYYLTVTDTNAPCGCKQSTVDTVTVAIELCDTVSLADQVFIPNIFSPNGDGSNDEFVVRGRDIANVDMRVYNRWGELIYQGGGGSPSWDGSNNGQAVNSGVFGYWCMVEFKDGQTELLKGNVTLVR